MTGPGSSSILGCDAARELASVVPQLLKGGLGWVGRYYGGNPRKDLTAPEARALCRAGLEIVTVWEAAGDRYSTFTAAQGTRDAQRALQQATAAGQPPGTAIYFAVDFPANPVQIASGIAAYFAAVATVFGDRPLGAYGPGDVLSFLSDNEYIDYAWLGGAMGWPGSRGYAAAGKADIVQGLPTTRYGLGFPVDPDTAIDSDFGAWSL